MTKPPSTAEIVIIGAGAAGLACAATLSRANRDWILLEADSRVGGRMKTDHLNGFILDHGFQVLLTAYPELEGLVNLEALQLGTFRPGAIIRADERFHLYADPFRSPKHIFSTLKAPIGTLGDKFKTGLIRKAYVNLENEQLFGAESPTTADVFRQLAFSQSFIERFLRPFFAGIYLDSELTTPGSMFGFIFKMFSKGDAALPANGIQAVPEQIASKLDSERIFLNSNVESLDRQLVRLSDGAAIKAKNIVIATDWMAEADLLGHDPRVGSNHVECHYFDLPAAESSYRWLYLNGSGEGAVNNLCFPNAVSPNFAPEGRDLLSVTTLKSHPDILSMVEDDLVRWFGDEARSWKHIKSYKLPHALPRMSHVEATRAVSPAAENTYLCGDYTLNPSLNGALASGRLVAEHLMKPQK